MMFGKKETPTVSVPLADVHCHILPGLDDGSQNIETSKAMIDLAYHEGIRVIVFTPHVRQPWLNTTPEEIRNAFSAVSAYASATFPKLKLYLGAEIYFSRGLVEEHPEKLRTINETDYLLVEFSTRVGIDDLMNGLQLLINEGYIPILAHIERYHCLWEDTRQISQLKNMGVYLQVNADTITEKGDRRFKKQLQSLLKNEMIHFIATDAHDLDHRKPKMAQAYAQILELTSEEYANRICYENAKNMLAGELI